MPAEAQNATEDGVHRTPGELFLFDEIEDVGLDLLLGKSIRRLFIILGQALSPQENSPFGCFLRNVAVACNS